MITEKLYTCVYFIDVLSVRNTRIALYMRKKNLLYNL